jgi:PhnB protein
MQISTHLSFNGQCKAALETYQRLLGGNLHVLTYGESPMADEVDPEHREWIVHGTLAAEGHQISGSDVIGDDFEKPQGFSITVSLMDRDEAERLFESLAAGGKIGFAFAETFWSPGYGMLVDAFGIPWEINTNRSPESD